MRKRLFRLFLFTGCGLPLIFLFGTCKKKNQDDCPNCPSVVSIIPTKAYGGDTISLSGKNFSSDPHSNIVKINGTTVSIDSIISGNTDQLSVIVPIGCGSGPVTVDLDAELTNSGTPPFFTYLYKASVSTFAGSWNADTHIVNTSVNATRFKSPGTMIIYNDVIFVQDGINKITKISNFSQSTDVTGITDEVMNIFPGTGIVYYVKRAVDGSNNNTYSVQDITQGIAVPVCDTLLYNGNNSWINKIFADNSGHFLTVYEYYSSTSGSYDSTVIVRSVNLSSLHGTTIFHISGIVFSITKFLNGYLYCLDGTNNKIYKISTAGSVSATYSLDLSFSGFSISDFITDNNGKIYFVSGQKNKVYSFISSNSVSEIAGGILNGHADGIGDQATFDNPLGISIAGNGAIYISDNQNHSIRKITLQ